VSRRLHIVILLLQTLILSQLPAVSAPVSSSAPTDAKLTEAHGHVFKRDFVDWTKESLSDPSPASVGEIVHEGMQIGTGDKSWAQLQWRHLSARAWANSVYAVAPNQRLVYLVGGEMLYQLDKNREDKSPYYVWTNLLQARIRGTTVLFQATKSVSRITVLEGTVEVLNKVDRSVVTLTPGVVYEIAAKNSPATENHDGLTNISLESSKPTPIFETTKTIASASAIDPMAAMNHPLIREFESPLSSLPLVTDALSSVQGRLENAGKNLIGTVTDILHDGLTITSVPRALSYSIGSELKNIAQIAPGTFDFFQPEGLIGGTAGIVGATANGVTGLPATLLSNTNLTNTNMAATSVGSLSSVMPTSGLMNTASMATRSVINPVSNTLTNTVGSVMPVTSTLTNTVTNTVGGTLGAVTGTLGTVGGAVGGTVGGTLNSVTNTLGGTLGGLGGLLGH
jgi:hypothetical protein